MTAWPSPRVAVFVSSTIGECADERAAARRAIESIKCDPILFEALGARPHPARVTYLEGLARAQICVIIWKESYGWIDPAINISGIEDEFRIATERNLDLLVYLKANAPNRDPRLKALIDEVRTNVTTHSYDDVSELQDQISSDISSVMSRAFIDRTARRSERLLDPSAVIAGTMPVGMTAVERPDLERRIDKSLQANRRTWLVGAPGAGKTILLAQWAVRHRASYVNARGLSLRHLLSFITAVLSQDSLVRESVSVEDAAHDLRAAWTKEAHWPLVIDDPSNVDELLKLLDGFGSADGSARVIFAAREPGEADTGNQIAIPGLTSSEAAEVIQRLPNAIRTSISVEPMSAGEGVLPLDIRRAAAARSAPQYVVFDDVEGVLPDPQTREILAFIVASPEPLTLEELASLASSDDNLVVLDGQLAALSFLLVDDGLGFRPVHDEIAKDLRESLGRRPALKKLVSVRLAQFFARSRRYLAAFELYREFDASRALRMAYRASVQASLEGRFSAAIRPMQFVVDAKRRSGERLDLATALISLSQAQDVAGNRQAAIAAIDEAEQISIDLKDADLQQIVQDQKLIKRLRHELRHDDLAALAALRERYKTEGREAESARLAIEEGVILISVGEESKSIPVLREAREIFIKVGDRYGVYVSTRNLISSLNMQPDGQKEAEELLQSLNDERDSEAARQRDRAWMCNILARRYRLDGRLDDAIAVAREAIQIGERIAEPYVVALNRIGLGNALREKGELDEALEEFKRCGKEAQAINRKEIDGLASRLAARVLLDKVETSAPYLHPQLYGQAEAFATYVIGLLSGSIAEMQAAQAYDCRGDARWGLGRKSEGRSDWAAAVRLLLELDEDQALSLLNNLARNIDIKDSPIESMQVMLATLPDTPLHESDDPWPMLIRLIGDGIMKGHPRGAGIYATVALKLSQQALSEQYEVGLWLRLMTLALENRTLPDDGRIAFVLSAFLAHARHRNMSLSQLTALMDITLGQSRAVRFHSVEDSLQASFHLGLGDRVLVVLNDIDPSPATRFLLAAVASFFVGFREEIDREFLAAPLENALYIRCSIVDLSKAPNDIREQLTVPDAGAVSMSVRRRASGQTHDIFIACSPDVQERCQGDMLKATELQFMYADLLRALLVITLGGEIESEVLRPKIVSLIRKTI